TRDAHLRSRALVRDLPDLARVARDRVALSRLRDLWGRFARTTSATRGLGRVWATTHGFKVFPSLVEIDHDGLFLRVHHDRPLLSWAVVDAVYVPHLFVAGQARRHIRPDFPLLQKERDRHRRVGFRRRRELAPREHVDLSLEPVQEPERPDASLAGGQS